MLIKTSIDTTVTQLISSMCIVGNMISQHWLQGLNVFWGGGGGSDSEINVLWEKWNVLYMYFADNNHCMFYSFYL